MALVQFIKSAQRLGFTLDEIEGLLALDDGTHFREARTRGNASWMMCEKGSSSCGASRQRWRTW